MSRAGRLWPGKVVRVVGDGRYLVHYEGYGDEWDEVVSADRVLPAEASLARDYRPGEHVLVSFQGRTLLAEVVAQLSPLLWRVRYDGFTPEATEDVGPDRLSRPFARPGAYKVGDVVTVDFSGTGYGGKVLAVTGADSVLVRFDGKSADYDQEVKLPRIKPGAPAVDPVSALGSAAASGPTAATAPTGVADGAAPAKPTEAKAESKAEKAKADRAAKDEKAKADKAAKDEKAKAAKEAAAKKAAEAALPKVGDAVLVQQSRGGYALGALVAPTATGWKVKYSAAAGAEEEDVAAARIVLSPNPVKGQLYALNQKVFVEWHGAFAPGKVVKEVSRGVYQIRFEGLGPQADEIVPGRRLRPRA